MLTTFSIPAVASKVEPHRSINYVPTNTLHDFWLNPWQIDYSRSCKYGSLPCSRVLFWDSKKVNLIRGEHGKFPDLCTLRIHFASILNLGFQATREPLEVRFTESDEGLSARRRAVMKALLEYLSLSGQPCVENVPIFSVKLVDGFTKSLCIQAVFGLLHHLAPCLICVRDLSVDCVSVSVSEPFELSVVNGALEL